MNHLKDFDLYLVPQIREKSVEILKNEIQPLYDRISPSKYNDDERNKIQYTKEEIDLVEDKIVPLISKSSQV